MSPPPPLRRPARRAAAGRGTYGHDGRRTVSVVPWSPGRGCRCGSRHGCRCGSRHGFVAVVATVVVAVIATVVTVAVSPRFSCGCRSWPRRLPRAPRRPGRCRQPPSQRASRGRHAAWPRRVDSRWPRPGDRRCGEPPFWGPPWISRIAAIRSFCAFPTSPDADLAGQGTQFRQHHGGQRACLGGGGLGCAFSEFTQPGIFRGASAVMRGPYRSRISFLPSRLSSREVSALSGFRTHEVSPGLGVRGGRTGGQMANREPLDSNTRKFVVIVPTVGAETLRLLDAYEDSPDAFARQGPPHRRFSCSSRAPALMRAVHRTGSPTATSLTANPCWRPNSTASAGRSAFGEPGPKAGPDSTAARAAAADTGNPPTRAWPGARCG